MKQVTLLFILFIAASCSVKNESDLSDQSKQQEADRKNIERYFEQLFHKKVSATIYIVHPEICGACSNDFLVKMSKTDLGSKFYLLATGKFKEEHQDAADKIRHKIKFVDSNKLGRIGISIQVPQTIVLKKGKVQSVDYLEL